jgi:hypothetical protein
MFALPAQGGQARRESVETGNKKGEDVRIGVEPPGDLMNGYDSGQPRER